MQNQCTSSDNTTCDAGYFCPSNAGTEAKDCLACKSDCATCTGTSAEDATCLTCADGKYLSGGACTECDTKCATCSGSEDTACQSCTNGNFLNVTTCATCVSGTTMNCTCGTSQNCSTCSDDMAKCATCSGEYDMAANPPCSKCKAGYFETSETPKTCTKCDEKCATCTAADSCQTCANGNVLNGNTCSACVSGQTMSCTCGTSKHCSTCDSNEMTKCKTCINDYDPNGETPCEKCKPKYFEDSTTSPSKCTACSSNCITCTSSTVCNTCEDGFYIKDNQCIACNTTQMTACTCKAAKNCQTCKSSEMGKCETCIGNFDAKGTTPCQNCLVGFFKGGDSGTDTCTACDGKCATCTALNTCQTCKDGNVLINSTCVPCSTNQMTACTCQTAKNCSTCETDTSKCKTCINNFDPSGGTACKNCLPAFFKQNKDGNETCTACSDNCTNCTSESACTACKDGFSLESNQCVSCADENCADCALNKNKCKKCVYNMYLNFRTQCQQCLNGDRIRCDCGTVVNCDTCSTDTPQTCGDCLRGYVIDKSGSCTICALDFVQIGDKCVRCRANYCEKCSADALKCEKCRNNFAPNHVGCEACSLDGPECVCQAAVHCAVCSADGDKCKSCVAGYQIDDKETCTNCAINYVKIGEKCVKCQVDNCDTCSTDAQTCVKCKNNFVPNGNKCDACRDNGPECLCGTAVNCATCAPNADKCKSCVGNFDPKATTPCTDCLDGFFKSDVSGKSTCTACSDKCTNCTSADTCTACQDGFSVDGNKCVTCEDTNCKICSANKNVCTKCNTGYLTVDGKCERQCYQGQSVCATNQICLTTCKTCSENCMTCEGSIASCTSCAPGFTLDRSSCAACSTGCADCTGNKNVCNLCKDGYFGISGVCAPCKQNATAQCECSGAANCATCNNAKSGTCGTCIAGYKMSASNTCTECADGYLMVDRVCTKCEKSCKICYESIDKCSSCADSYTMSIKQTCEKDCTTVLTNGKACVGGKVVECDDDYDQITACKCGAAVNCQECNERNMNTCESCMPGYKLIGGSCGQCAVGATTVGLFCFDPSIGSQNFLSGGAIAGIVIAVLVVIGLVAGGAFWYVKRSKHTPAEIGLVDRRLQ
ncbi:Cysteine-rich membrane protein 2 [Spironucleus salmonicida]|uniref:Cysteine-rich membrane protein 2 n=1 Tax=Spironucleus salmonicida TaxID=348837 RepID=V6LL53_9EUKA|nr:Cysteine-rich membrane protein 2 [Spironucleus salmonicida]|eukprot:EST45360.1 Cysteine-rich membrane protein 2 [Spironucleus salmonicida]